MESTTTTPNSQRPPARRVRPARSIRLCVKPQEGSPGVVRITVGDETADYFLTEFAADWGRGFLVEKIVVGEKPASRYHVNIDGTKRECECRGWARWQKCRHADGLAALIAAGRL
jgi:hypothetical protein